MAGKKGMKHYPREVKLEAVRLFYEEGKSYREIRDILRLRDPKRVDKWLHQYRAEGVLAFRKKRRGPGRPPQKENTAAYIARLEMENELLKNTSNRSGGRRYRHRK